jgi:transposase
MVKGRPKKRNFKRLDQYQRGRVIGLCEGGSSYREIGRIIGCDHKTVERLWKKVKKTDSSLDLPRTPRGRATTSRQDRIIKRIHLKRPKSTAVSIAKELKVECGKKICSNNTIRNRLKECGLNGRVARHKPLITEVQATRRLLWAQKYIKFTVQEWKQVEFSDESPFTLFPTCGRQYVWRKPGEEYENKYLIPTVKHGGGKIQVWGSFSYYGVGELFWIQGKLTGAKYREILKNHMAPHLRELQEENGIKMKFQHDNDPKHTSNVVKNYLKNAKFEVLDWASQSADLNPIENLWDQVKDQIEARTDRASSLSDVFRIVQEEWARLPLDFIQNLITSMPRRCQAVIDSKGYSTKY